MNKSTEAVKRTNEESEQRLSELKKTKQENKNETQDRFLHVGVSGTDDTGSRFGIFPSCY